MALAFAGSIGCASVPLRTPAPAVSPAARAAGESTAPRAGAGTSAPGGSNAPSARSPAVVDSGPSADAVAVLATIPEPLTPAERVPPPAAGAAAGGAAAAAAARAAEEALRAAAPAIVAEDTLIPVPAPTEPLGDRPGARPRALPDTLPPPAAAAPAAARPDSCWRIQVAAPTDREEADLKRQAAESVLLVSFVIDHEKTRFKVRNRDCLGREAADQLRRRAIESGFDGSFPVLEVKK